MDLTIASADFTDPRLADFLQQHLDDMAPTAPAESRHALDLAGLQGPGVRMWVGHLGDDVVVTGATAQLESGHAELKSMRTSPAHRGQGLARAMLDHLLADARATGVRRLSLETGSMDFFAPARDLYRSAGFVECQPFGSHGEDPNSQFFTLLL